MTTLDLFLQQQRIARAKLFLPKGCTLLDIGCHQGEMLHQLANKISEGTGIDPLCNGSSNVAHITLINGSFPQSVPENKRFDCITALALIEHIPDGQHAAFFKHCFHFLNIGGLLICTIPSHHVDKILVVLQFLKLATGMSTDEHHGYDAKQTPSYAKAAGFNLLHHHRFQMGLNNLFVFMKPLA